MTVNTLKNCVSPECVGRVVVLCVMCFGELVLHNLQMQNGKSSETAKIIQNY
jgi:hypothetical protein